MSEIERLYAETQMLEETAVRLRADLQRFAAAASEAASAITAIRSLKNGGDSEILVQLGMGAMLRANISSVERIPVNVGAGVVVEKTPDDAMNFLESRIKELDVSAENTRANLDKVLAGLEQNRSRLENAAAAQSDPGHV